MAFQLGLVKYKKNGYIIVEGSLKADRFYIIREGKVRLSKEVEVVMEEGGNILGPGDFFGVVSTMSGRSQIETAHALTDVTLISVLKEQYPQLIQNNTPVAMKIIFEFSKRMRYLDKALTRQTLKNSAPETPSQLFIVGEYYARQSQYAQAYYAYSRYLRYCPSGEFVNLVRERLMKIAPYAAGVKLDFGPNEFNRAYPRNAMIFSEGENGEELFIIQKGAVKIVKIVGNNEMLLAVLKEGDIFGEMALLESKPRAACAIAYEDCNLTAVNRANFENMVQTKPQIVTRLTTLLADRIWFIYKQLANTLMSDPVGRLFDALMIQLEKNGISVKDESWTFDFGPMELANMAGIPQREIEGALRSLRKYRVVQVIKDKDRERIHLMSITEIAKQAEIYRKASKRR